MNLLWGREQLSVPLESKRNFTQEIPNWVTRINPNSTQIPNPFFRDEETQFDLATQGDPTRWSQK